MENGCPTLGLEDGTIDVEHLLVEPHDGYISIDSGICFNEKIPKNSTDVLAPMPNEVEFFRMHKDFGNMGTEYLLGRLQASVSDIQMLPSSAGSDTPWKSDLSKIIEVPYCQNDQFKPWSSQLSDIPGRQESKTSAGQKPLISPTSFTSQSLNKFHDSSSCSFQDTSSDENDTKHSPSGEMLCSPESEKTDILPSQKRTRKPTQRYIDELVDPISAYPKKRREVSSSTIKNKSIGVKDHHRKCHMGSRMMTLRAEESSFMAVQVPFGSLVHKETPKSHAYDTNQKKRDECITSVHLKKRDASVMSMSQKKKDVYVTTARLKKRDLRLATANQKKKDSSITASPKKRDNCVSAASQKTTQSSEEGSGQRKHHRLWSTAEVRKLIDGVSQYGVGRWSRIKKLFFSTSAHRTSVDLKDKWRNLLKASGIQEQGNQQGEKKRNVAWRPLPKSILRRVCELAAIYPYPEVQKPKIEHIHYDDDDDSPNGSTDTTLRDYRRILQSIDVNCFFS